MDPVKRRFKLPTRWLLVFVFFLGSAISFIGVSTRVTWMEWLGYCIIGPFVIRFLRIVIRPLVDEPLASRLVVEGLPPLSWTNEKGWSCEALMPPWDKIVLISFHCPDFDLRTSPNPAQLAAYHALFIMGHLLRRRVPIHLLNDPDELRKISRHLGKVPDNQTQVEQLISLRAIEIEILPWEDQFELCVVYDFDCEWNRPFGFRIRSVGEHVFQVSEV